MDFNSDNCAGAHPAVMASMTRHGEGFAASYGASDLDAAVAARLAALFECELDVFPVATGTAANALALAAAGIPGGIALCHSEAHVIEDECGAPEFFSGGRLAAVGGAMGKIDPEALETAFGKFIPGFVHHGRPSAVTITQSTEAGTVYSLAEIERIGGIAARHKVPLHMDGARFANALVALDASPAEMTWRRGVEFLSFGATKNGCWCAEALICFNPERREEIAFLRKRAGQLFSKSRFVAAQFDAYLHDGLWLDLARHSNGMASQLADLFRAANGCRLAWEPQANEVFAILSDPVAQTLKAGGCRFHEWSQPALSAEVPLPGERLYRFVTSFATRPEDIVGVARLLAA